MPVKNDREYRSVAEFRAADKEESKFIVEGYASTFEPYELFRDGDTVIYEQIDTRAFDAADFSDCCFLYNHEGRVFARTRNKTLTCEIDAHGLKIRADLSSTEASRAMWEDIHSGLIDQMSFAFTVADEEYDKASHTRVIKQLRKIYDVSAVSIPQNPTTSIATRNFCEGVIAKEQQEFVEREKAIKRINILLEVSK